MWKKMALKAKLLKIYRANIIHGELMRHENSCTYFSGKRCNLHMADFVENIPYGVGTFLSSVKTQTHNIQVYLYNEMHIMPKMQLVHIHSPNQIYHQIF